MMTMRAAGEKLTELCQREKLPIRIDYVDLWTSDYLRPGIDLVIEMFPYFRNLKVPIISGKPFINRQGEADLLAQLVNMVREINSQ